MSIFLVKVFLKVPAGGRHISQLFRRIEHLFFVLSGSRHIVIVKNQLAGTTKYSYEKGKFLHNSSHFYITISLTIIHYASKMLGFFFSLKPKVLNVIYLSQTLMHHVYRYLAIKRFTYDLPGRLRIGFYGIRRVSVPNRLIPTRWKIAILYTILTYLIIAINSVRDIQRANARKVNFSRYNRYSWRTEEYNDNLLVEDNNSLLNVDSSILDRRDMSGVFFSFLESFYGDFT